MRAHVAHFYGWSDCEISRMSYNLFLEYYKASKIIKAEETLQSYTSSVYNNLKKEAQKRVWADARRDIEKYYERSEEDKNKNSNIQRIIEASRG